MVDIPHYKYNTFVFLFLSSLGLDDESLNVKSFITGSDVHQLKGHKGKVGIVLYSKVKNRGVV